MLTKLRNDSASRTLRFYQDTERNCRERKWFQFSREWSEGRCNCGLITSHMTRALTSALSYSNLTASVRHLTP